MREIEDFYQVSDGDDWLPATMRAQASTAAGSTGGFTLSFRPREYSFSDAIHLIRGMSLVGAGAALEASCTRLVFPPGVSGIVCDVPQADTPVDQGDTSIIERLAVLGDRRTATTAHGIVMNARLYLRDVYVQQFSGDGIRIRASHAFTPPGGANGWQIYNCIVEQCGGNGLYVHGDDTNAGCAIALSCIDNLGWGIVDESPLNNTYVACHVASVSTLAYRALSVIPADEVHPAPYQRGAGCLFVGCYAEDDTLSEIDEPNAVFGGQVHGIQGSAVWLRQGPRALFPNGVAAGNQVPSPSGKNVGGVLGGTSTADTALELWDDLNGGEVYRLVFSSKENPNTISDPAGYLELKYDNVSGTILCFGTSKADLGPNSLWMPGGYYLGVPELAQRVRVTMGSARPTSGPAQRGDRVLNAAPVPGDPENGYAGWICVESSSPANPAGMWKGFGAIEV